MRCTQCNYRLWSLGARKCPECGKPFRPSEFEFVPNSVRFCCPHCSQAYYGTGLKGHLEPREFGCVSCGMHIEMDQMVLLPALGVADEQTDGVVNPWIEPNRTSGPVKAWLRTIGWALTRPGDLIRATPAQGGGWKALLFAVVCQCVLYLCGVAVAFAGLFALVGVLGPGGGGSRNLGLGWNSLGPIVGFSAFLVAMFLGIMVVGTLITHAALRVSGGCAHGIKRTWQAMCYSSGANVLSAIPCAGPYFGWVWWVVSAILMVKDGQKVHGGRAAFAVLITPVLALLTIVGLYGMVIYFAMQGPVARAQQTMRPMIVNMAVVGVSAGQRAQWTHGAAPLASGSLNPSQFFDTDDESDGPLSKRLAATTIGGIDLASWPHRTPAEQQSAVARAQASLTADVVAYRIGDTVLYRPGAVPGREWTLVVWRESRDPDASEFRDILVFCGDHSTSVISEEDFPEALDTQNRLRAQFGLPLIPHPADVGSNTPVVRDDEKHAPADSSGPADGSGSGEEEGTGAPPGQGP